MKKGRWQAFGDAGCNLANPSERRPPARRVAGWERLRVNEKIFYHGPSSVAGTAKDGWTRRKAAWRPRRYTRIHPTRLALQPRILDCGGKRSATPLLDATGHTESGVAAVLQSSLRFASAGCDRSPNLCHPCAKLQDCITDWKKGSTMLAVVLSQKNFSLISKSQVCFHKRMVTAGLQKPIMHEVVHSPSYNHCWA